MYIVCTTVADVGFMGVGLGGWLVCWLVNVYFYLDENRQRWWHNGDFVVSQTGMQAVSWPDVLGFCAFQIEQNEFVRISVCSSMCF